MILRIAATLIVFFSLSTISSHAEIYSYTDEQGKVHFTDVTPSEDKNAVQLDEDKPQAAFKSDKKKTGQNLQTYLTDLIQPNNDIEKATLAVVKIETPTGTGSGFFVSEQGYIVTNKHVVRMTESKHWKSKQQKMNNGEEKIEETKAYLQQKTLELKKYKEKLDDYKERVANASEADKATMQQTYNYYLKRYNKQKKDYKKINANYLTAKKEFSNYKRKVRQSKSTNIFKIILKDNTELQARLIKLSPNYDLALLQLTESYKTPFLSNSNNFTQGMDVYAIGSPLGFKDYVTKGVVMGIEQGYIATDTQILPGNSGGPLITPDGHVVGINTAALRAGDDVGSEVFGYAIPIAIAEKEFVNELN